MNSPRIGKTVWTITAANFFQMAFARVYVLLPAYLAASGITDPKRIGLLVGVFYLSTFARPFVGFFTDQAGFRRVLAISAVLSVAAAIGLLITNPALTLQMIAWRILAGASFSFFGVALTAYQSVALTGENRGAGFSVVSAVGDLPFLIVVPFCERLLNRGQLQAYMLVPAVLGMAALVGTFLLPHVDNPAAARGNRPGKGRSVMENPQALMLLLSIALLCSVDACLLSIAALGRESGIAVSGFLAATAVTSVCVRFFGRSLVDRLPRVRTVWACGALAAVFMGTAALTTPLGRMIFTTFGALYGLFIGLGYPSLLALIADVAAPELRSRITSLFWFFMGLAYMIIPVAMGYLVPHVRYRGAFLVVNLALMPLIALVGLRWERLRQG